MTGFTMTNTQQSTGMEQSDLLERIQERYGSLRKAERIVADYLRDNAGRRLDASITELGRTLRVSEATVSRVSRALGYGGYPDMKLSLAEGSRKRNAIVNLPIEIKEGDSLISTSSKLAHLLTAGITGTQRMLDAERLELATEALRAARKIVFVGVGGAAAICGEAAHMFMKAGFQASSHSDGYTQIVVAATLKATDVMVGISHTGTTKTVANSLRLAGKSEATTIAITSSNSSDVARAAGLVLTTWGADQPLVPLHGDFLEGRLSQLFLIDLLYIATLFRAGEEPIEALRATGEALETHYHYQRDE
jgi:RpiR family carbohydrate utilization transcriptional regulator